MALVKRQANTTRLLVALAVTIVVAGVGYFLVQQFIHPPTPTTETGTVGSTTVITNFGESILSDPRYLHLRSFGQNVNADVNVDGGNPNPFQ